MKVSDYIMEFLADHGVKHVFMLAGGGSMHLVDSLGRNKQLEYVCCLHEQAASFAAEAYAEYSRTPSAVLVTTGPGGTNCVTGVAAAWMESSPVIFISGQVRRAHFFGHDGIRSFGPQEVDIISIVKPITKYAARITFPSMVRYHLEEAWYQAISGRRGPVWLDVPLDVQAEEIDPEKLDAFIPEKQKKDDFEAQCLKTMELLEKAQRPVLLIGNGARRAGALVEKLCKIAKIPVLTTWKAADMFPEDSPLFCGRPGAIASRGANFTQQNADLLIVLGARLDLPQIAFSHENFAPKAKKVIVEVDSKELSKFDMKVDVPVNSSVENFLWELMPYLEDITLPDTSAWLRKAKDWQKRYPVILPEYWKERGYVNTYVLMDVLSDLCAWDDVLAPGSSGACSDIFYQSFRVKKGQRIINAPTLGAMGTGLPGSIGACLASAGTRRTICVCGDGGFQLNIQDLETVRRLHLPIKFFILCNGSYASITNMQKSHFKGNLVGSDPSSGLTLPDVSKVASAYGVRSRSIYDHSLIRQQVEAVLSMGGPVICDVHTSPNQKTQPRATSSLRPDGTIVSLPMEDMAPLLPRDEFNVNMTEGV
jgi:acetolactate synthase-1/2/3 large subunit